MGLSGCIRVTQLCTKFHNQNKNASVQKYPWFLIKTKAKFNTFASLIIHIYLWNLSQELHNTQTKSLTHFDENLETFGEGST